MFKIALFLLCSVAILVSVEGAEINISQNHTTEAPGNTTEHPLTTTPTTTTITTSTSTTTSTTLKPTTTSTSAPTTPNAPTTTPTPAPNPKPVPKPETGKWIVNGSGVTCIIAQMALQFNVSYITEDNKTDYKVLNLPRSNETSAQGVCGDSKDLEQNITITWHAFNSTTANNSLMLHFYKNMTKYQYTLHHLEVKFAPEEFLQNATYDYTTFVHSSDQFSTGLNNSYRCLKSQSLNLNSTDNKTEGVISVSNLQFQAFHIENTTSFGFAEDCAFDTPDIVPIAVGCALAALVVVVLIAYLVGRRRSQARGYLSM